MIYIFAIDFVLSTCPKMLAHVIFVMEWNQRLLGTLEVVFDWQIFLVRRALTVIELLNVVYPYTIFKYNHIVNIYV
jgi:hypothetical protein